MGVHDLVPTEPAEGAGEVEVLQGCPEVFAIPVVDETADKGLLEPVGDGDQLRAVVGAQAPGLTVGHLVLSQPVAGGAVPRPTLPAAVVLLGGPLAQLARLLANGRQGLVTGTVVPAAFRPPDGDTVLQAVSEVVGLKGVPVGEAHEAPVGPLKIHLQFQVVETNPQLLHLLLDLLGDELQLRHAVDAEQVAPAPQTHLLGLLPAALLGLQAVAVALEGLPAGFTLHLHVGPHIGRRGLGGRGVGLLLADVGQRDAAVAVLPAA